MNRALLFFARAAMIIVVLVLCFALSVHGQQNVQFTQYMFNGVVINPAYAGADEALSLTFIHRSQWAGVENAPQTQTLAGHTLFKQKHTGVGISLTNDRIGVHKNISAFGNYAYHIKTGLSSYFSMGLQAGFHNRKSDYASLLGGSNNDPKLSSSIISNTFFDFGMGLYYRSPSFHIGLSVPQIMPETISLNDTVSVRLKHMQYFLFSKYRISISENTVVEPSVLLKYLSDVPLSFDVNANLIYRKVLTLGLSYRNKESIDFLLKGQVTPQLQFGYSYDHAIGNIARLSNGSHEIMIHYLFSYSQSNLASPR